MQQPVALDQRGRLQRLALDAEILPLVDGRVGLRRFAGDALEDLLHLLERGGLALAARLFDRVERVAVHQLRQHVPSVSAES